VAALFFLPGCAMLISEARPDTAAPPTLVKGLVLAVDGAGGFQVCSRTIRETAAKEKMPLEVRNFRWTHGYCRVLSDQMHAAHLQRAGRTLSDLVQTCRQQSPELPIFLIGHSAGCGVVLAAAENLPAGTLERIVLLAPAVSAKHDLRPALASACRGIDVFYSGHDWACLGLGTLLAGTTDRCWTRAAAGKVGFQPICNSPEDEALYAKLRQYPWDPSLTWAGHRGGHYGAHQPRFLRAFVLPLLAPQQSAVSDQQSASTSPIADR
jgi:pimeloyl-ACP methyl ester carboxylesterase